MSEIKPALTAEEWRQWEEQGMLLSGRLPLTIRAVLNSAGSESHSIAALALYDQPFGFTREDVKLIRYAASRTDGFGLPNEAAQLRDTADRIEALLPKEGA